MDMTIDQQVAMDEALVPHAHRLRIGRSNFRLLSNISSMESTLQLVYDVLRLTPFFKAFLVTTDVLEIYMQEFWATATVHHHSIRFKMDTKKHIVNLESFREMLHIYPRLPVTPPPTAAVGPRLSTSAKGKQPTTTSKAKSLTALSKVAMTEAQHLKLATKRSLQQTHISQASGSDDDNAQDDDQEDEGDDNENDQEEGSDDEQAYDKEDEEFLHPSFSTHDEEETRDEESFDPIPKTPENINDEGNGKENLGTNVGREEGHDEEDEEDKLYKDININLGRGVQMVDVHTTQEFEDSHVTLTSVNPDRIESIFETTFQMDVHTPTSVVPLPVSAPTLTPSTIATVTTIQQAPTPSTTASSTLLQDLPNFSSLFGFDHRLKTLEANFSEFMQTNQFAGASDRLHDEAQAENDEFLKTINENMQKIIKEQVKEHVKTSYAVAADLSEMELKKTLIEKMEGNKSIHRSNEKRNLYKALVKSYESDKIILDTYGDAVTLKRCRDDDADKDKEPSAGLDRGELMDTPVDFFAFLMNQLKVDTLTPELLAAPTYELMKGSFKSLAELEFFLEEVYKATKNQLDWVNPEGQQYPRNLLKPLPLIPNSQGRRVIPYDHFINNDLEYLCGGALSRKYTTSVTKTKAATTSMLSEESPIGFAVNRESARDVYSKHRIIAVTELKIVEWHNYKHLDWITVHRDDDKLYKFKEGDFKRLCIQDIEDTLLLLVQGKLTNLTVEEHFAFNVSLRIDGTLTDVHTTLNDHLKGIQMKYLPQSIWRKSDKDRATTMIQAIDKQLKTRRIMRILERFVGERLYEGDFRMLQKTI
nr:hypothetical protein [Tanacetum cinerariifolium]